MRLGWYAIPLAFCACNEGHIDPSDAAVVEVRPDVPAEVAPAGPELYVERAGATATGLEARVCWRGAIDPATLAVSFGETTVDTVFDPASGDCLEAAATLPAGKHSLRVSAKDDAGAEHALWLPLWVEAAAFDWRRALLYMVMTDRFRDSDGDADAEPDVPALSNYQGGDFAGLEGALEEGWFDALGVDALWLTPVLDNPDGGFIGADGVHLYAGYHGYWPMSLGSIDEHFAAGGASAEDGLRSLIRAAHARGVRVVLDVVLNHVHEQHPYCAERPAMCKSTCVCGTAGCDWEARALDCQFASYLPDLDFRDPGTRARVVGDLVAFVSAFDFDGLRLDAVKHMDTSVLAALREPLDGLTASGGAPFWLVGETFAGGTEQALIASFLGDDALDGQFDFPLFWAVRDALVNDGSFRALEAAVAASEAAYGEHMPLMSPFVGNHDVERLATALAKNDLGPWGGTEDVVAVNTGETPSRWDVINPLTMAMAFVLTLPGVPLVYMGDELGLGGSGDPDNRRMLPLAPATDQREILRRVRELGRARREHPVLALGERRELWQDDDVYVQARWMAVGGAVEVVLVAMNKGAERAVTVTLPADLAAADAPFQSLLSTRTISASGDQLTIALAPWEYVLLQKMK